MNNATLEELKEMDAKNEYYAILGVTQSATSTEIKRAYKALMLKFFPDKNLGNQDLATQVARKIILAHETLSDETSRKKYDASLMASSRAHEASPAKNIHLLVAQALDLIDIYPGRPEFPENFSMLTSQDLVNLLTANNDKFQTMCDTLGEPSFKQLFTEIATLLTVEGNKEFAAGLADYSHKMEMLQAVKLALNELNQSKHLKIDEQQELFRQVSALGLRNSKVNKLLSHLQRDCKETLTRRMSPYMELYTMYIRMYEPGHKMVKGLSLDELINFTKQERTLPERFSNAEATATIEEIRVGLLDILEGAKNIVFLKQDDYLRALDERSLNMSNLFKKICGAAHRGTRWPDEKLVSSREFWTSFPWKYIPDFFLPDSIPYKAETRKIEGEIATALANYNKDHHHHKKQLHENDMKNIVDLCYGRGDSVAEKLTTRWLDQGHIYLAVSEKEWLRLQLNLLPNAESVNKAPVGASAVTNIKPAISPTNRNIQSNEKQRS